MPLAPEPVWTPLDCRDLPHKYKRTLKRISFTISQEFVVFDDDWSLYHVGYSIGSNIERTPQSNTISDPRCFQVKRLLPGLLPPPIFLAWPLKYRCTAIPRSNRHQYMKHTHPLNHIVARGCGLIPHHSRIGRWYLQVLLTCSTTAVRTHCRLKAQKLYL